MPLKIKEHYATIPDVPKKFSVKKKRPKILAYVVEENCTGCEACVQFCPVDCIEHTPKEYSQQVIPPVHIRYDECIGCKICERVCTALAWDAIVMRKTEEVEAELGLVIHEKWPVPPEVLESEAASAASPASASDGTAAGGNETPPSS